MGADWNRFVEVGQTGRLPLRSSKSRPLRSALIRFIRGHPRSIPLLLLALLIGCTHGQTEKPQSAVQDEIKVTVVDRPAFDAVVAGLRGRVVLVDCWATWCVPCLEQLPHTGKLASQHGDGGFAAVTLSFDDPDKLPQVRRALSAIGVGPVTHLISKFGGSPRSSEAFDVPGGALPHYKLYDRSGKLRRTFELDPSAEQQFTPSDMETAVAELLAE